MRFLERLPRTAESAIIQFRPQLQISCLIPEHKRIVVYQNRTEDEFEIPLTLWTSQIAVFHGVPKTAKGSHSGTNHRYLVHAVKPGDKPGQILGEGFHLGNTAHDEAICWGYNPFPSDLRHAVNQYFLSSFAGIHDPKDAIYSSVNEEPLSTFVSGVLAYGSKKAREGIDYYVNLLKGSSYGYSTSNVASMFWCAIYALGSAKVREKEIEDVKYLLQKAKELLLLLKTDAHRIVKFPLAKVDLEFVDDIIRQEDGEKYIDDSKCSMAELMKITKPAKPKSRVIGYAPKFRNTHDLTRFTTGDEYVGLKGPLDSIYISDEPQDIELAGRSFLSNQIVEDKSLLRKKGDVPIAIGKADLIDGKYKIVLIPSGQMVMAKPEDVTAARPQDKETMYRGYTKNGTW